jgi:hypothetical protein
MFSDIDHLITIAETAFQRAERISERNITRLPGGRAVLRPDRSRSKRLSLVAIVFAGMACEALIYADLLTTHSKSRARRLSQMALPEQFRAIGVTDPKLLRAANRLRTSRNAIVHERPRVLGDKDDTSWRNLRIAQTEARYALACLTELRLHLHRRLAADLEGTCN